jgi:uncharacterized protein (TIGR02145 family)
MRYLLTSLLCVLTLSLTAQVDCPNPYDGNGDGAIGISDLLGLLALFGDVDSDSDGVFDSVDECIDDTACNYQSNPTLTCVYYDAIGVCGGHCLDDEDGDGVCDSALFINCGDQIAHGYNYTTVQIGEQCWFAENCRYLPEVSPSSEGNETDPYYYVNDYQGTDVASAQGTTNYETYGVLYNWSAVMTAGICPSGWHIPSDEEFTELTDFLGGESVAAHAMKSTSGWNNDGNGSNSSGFSGLPGGYRYSGGFSSNGGSGNWWSASESGSNSWARELLYYLDNVNRHLNLRGNGYSARCVRD